jgi:phospholipase/carboxylesterase
MDLLDGFLLDVTRRYRVQESRLLLVGFAMGGSMTYRYGLARPERFAGLALLSAGEANPVELRPLLPSGLGQSIFIAHGTSDPLLNVEWSRNARRFLEGEGYRATYREYDAGHEICADTVIDLSKWVAEVLPPF